MYVYMHLREAIAYSKQSNIMGMSVICMYRGRRLLVEVHRIAPDGGPAVLLDLLLVRRIALPRGQVKPSPFLPLLLAHTQSSQVMFTLSKMRYINT